MVVIVSSIISFNSYTDRKKVEHLLVKEDLGVDKIITIKREDGTKGIDSDQDGLEDWEEILWGTDTLNPDSDKDGTNDGEETDSNRNPLQAGPGDEVKSTGANGENIFYDKKVAGTLTDNLSINLAANYFNLKQNESFTPESGDELIGQIVSDVSEITTMQDNHYSLSSLITHAGNKEADKSYGELLASNQISLIKTLRSYEPLEENEYLVAAGDLYKSSADRLKTFSVPSAVKESHLQIMNNYRNMAIVFNDMKNYDIDPVRALLAVRNYQTLEQKQEDAYTKISNYFIESDIIFDNNNAGSIWNTYQ